MLTHGCVAQLPPSRQIAIYGGPNERRRPECVGEYSDDRTERGGLCFKETKKKLNTRRN